MHSPAHMPNDPAYAGRIIIRLKEKLESYTGKPFRVGQQEATLEPLYAEVYHPDRDDPVGLDSALDWLEQRPWLDEAQRVKVRTHRDVLRRSHAVTVPVGGKAQAFVQAVNGNGNQIDKAWTRGSLGQQPATANRRSVRGPDGALRRGAFGPRPEVAPSLLESGLERMPTPADPGLGDAPRIGLVPVRLDTAALPVAGGRARRLRVARAAAPPQSGLEIFTEPVSLPPGVVVEACYLLQDAPLPCNPPTYHKGPASLDIVHVKAAFADVKPGTGVRLAVLERVGWLPEKSLLPRHVAPTGPDHYTPLESLDSGDIKSFDWERDSSHAARTLAVLEADDCRGVAPGANVKFLSSLWRDAGGRWVANIANAILNAVLHLRPGDILLLEQQGMDVTFLEQTQPPFAPVEVDPAIWQAIRLATDVGIIVIEPAGNGGRAIALTGGDSGAIVVGYCEAGPDRKRGAKSNHGARVDCFAWGDITLGGGLTYDGTSSAAAQIAGVAALIQSHYKIRNPGQTLSPEQMRAALKHNGTAALGQGIGVMPNLTRIIERINQGVPF